MASVEPGGAAWYSAAEVSVPTAVDLRQVYMLTELDELGRCLQVAISDLL